MSKEFPQKSFISTNLSPKNVYLDGNTVISSTNFFSVFADGPSNYYFDTEAGVILDGVPDDGWVILYVNSYTGKIESEMAVVDPVVYVSEFPSSPVEGEIFYHIIDSHGYKYVREQWSKFIYLPFCEIVGGDIRRIYSGYSHGENYLNQSIVAGNILFDENQKPLYVREGRGIRFLTDVDEWALSLQNVRNLTSGNTFTTNIASTSITKYSLLKRDPNYAVSICSSMADSPTVSIALNDCVVGEFCPILEKGFIKDVNWNWVVQPNTNLYCSKTGTLSLVPDFTGASIQIVGYVVDVDTIFFDPQDKIYINNLVSLNS